MRQLFLAAGAVLAALVLLGCTATDRGSAAEPAVGAVDLAGELTVFSDGDCAAALPASASTAQVAGPSLLALRFVESADGAGSNSSLIVTLRIEPPVLSNGTEPPVGAELLIPLIMREANVALRLNGRDVAFDQPSRNGYVSPDLRSGYLSATTVDGERVAINFLCPRSHGSGG